MIQTPTQLNPDILALTKAFRQVESGGNFQAKGGSGEYGAYQYTPDTWNSQAKQYLGQSVPLNQATPEQQNQVAYMRFADLKNQGYNIGQIASIHNAGAGEPNAYLGTFSNGKPSVGKNSYGVQYNVPQYAKQVATYYHQFKQTAQTGADQPAPQDQGGITGNESPGQAGFNAVVNTPGSALKFGMGALQSLNPLKTVENAGNIASGFQDLAGTEGAGQAIWDIIKGLPKAAYETLVPQGIRQAIGGDLQGASKTFQEDPFGQAAPVVLAGQMAAQGLDAVTGLKTPAEAGTLYHGASADTAALIKEKGFIGSQDFPGNGMVSLTKNPKVANTYAGPDGEVLRVNTTGLSTKIYPSMEDYTNAIDSHAKTIGTTESGLAEQALNKPYDIVRIKNGGGPGEDLVLAKPTAVNLQPDAPGMFTNAFDKTGEAIARPVMGAGRIPGTLSRSILSKVTGLEPKTISALVENPEAFSKLRQEAIDRPSVASDFKSGIDEFVKSKAETGAEYQNIRSLDTPIPIPDNFVGSILDKYGLSVEKGKVMADTESLTRQPADLAAIQRFYDDWGNKTQLTPNEILNMRQDADLIAKFDSSGKTTAAMTVAKEIRREINDQIRPNVPGLKELDTKIAPQIEFFKKIKKDFLTKDGEFKDGAVNKIANAKGLGKESLLARMEQIRPGITKSIEVLKAVEDIEKAEGIKVGNYTRSILEGSGITGGIITGNIPLVVAAIITHPSIAVQIMRGFGYTGKAAIPIIGTLQMLSGQVEPALKTASFNQDQNNQQ